MAAEARRKGRGRALLATNGEPHRNPYGGQHSQLLSGTRAHRRNRGRLRARPQRKGVGARIKPLLCNDSGTERMSVDVSIDERTLREALTCGALRAIVREAGAWA